MKKVVEEEQQQQSNKKVREDQQHCIQTALKKVEKSMAVYKTIMAVRTHAALLEVN